MFKPTKTHCIVETYTWKQIVALLHAESARKSYNPETFNKTMTLDKVLTGPNHISHANLYYKPKAS